MKELKNWTEVSQGYFRFVIAPNVCYEIFVEHWYHDSPIETAKASLCLFGVWANKNLANSSEREWLAKELPIQELLEIAYKDNQKYNKLS